MSRVLTLSSLLQVTPEVTGSIHDGTTTAGLIRREISAQASSSSHDAVPASAVDVSSSSAAVSATPAPNQPIRPRAAVAATPEVKMHQSASVNDSDPTLSPLKKSPPGGQQEPSAPSFQEDPSSVAQQQQQPTPQQWQFDAQNIQQDVMQNGDVSMFTTGDVNFQPPHAPQSPPGVLQMAAPNQSQSDSSESLQQQQESSQKKFPFDIDKMKALNAGISRVPVRAATNIDKMGSHAGNSTAITTMNNMLHNTGSAATGATGGGTMSLGGYGPIAALLAPMIIPYVASVYGAIGTDPPDYVKKVVKGFSQHGAGMQGTQSSSWSNYPIPNQAGYTATELRNALNPATLNMAKSTNALIDQITGGESSLVDPNNPPEGAPYDQETDQYAGQQPGDFKNGAPGLPGLAPVDVMPPNQSPPPQTDPKLPQLVLIDDKRQLNELKARRECISRGMDLVQPKTQDEYNAFKKFCNDHHEDAKGANANGGRGILGCWIGVYKIERSTSKQRQAPDGFLDRQKIGTDCEDDATTGVPKCRGRYQFLEFATHTAPSPALNGARDVEKKNFFVQMVGDNTDAKIQIAMTTDLASNMDEANAIVTVCEKRPFLPSYRNAGKIQGGLKDAKEKCDDYAGTEPNDLGKGNWQLATPHTADEFNAIRNIVRASLESDPETSYAFLNILTDPDTGECKGAHGCTLDDDKKEKRRRTTCLTATPLTGEDTTSQTTCPGRDAYLGPWTPGFPKGSAKGGKASSIVVSVGSGVGSVGVDEADFRDDALMSVEVEKKQKVLVICEPKVETVCTAQNNACANNWDGCTLCNIEDAAPAKTVEEEAQRPNPGEASVCKDDSDCEDGKKCTDDFICVKPSCTNSTTASIQGRMADWAEKLVNAKANSTRNDAGVTNSTNSTVNATKKDHEEKKKEKGGVLSTLLSLFILTCCCCCCCCAPCIVYKRRQRTKEGSVDGDKGNTDPAANDALVTNKDSDQFL